MKKSMLALAVGLGLAFANLAYSASDPHQVGVDVHVNDMFKLVLDQTALNFGNADVGTELTPLTVACQVYANHGMQWTVALQANPLTHTDGVTQIPGDSFRYFHTYDNPDGNEIPAVGTDAPVPTVEQTIFESGPNIYNANYAGFGVGFKIIVPPTQKTGDYSTVVNMRLVDGF